jgi:hypothetical protein
MFNFKQLCKKALPLTNEGKTSNEQYVFIHSVNNLCQFCGFYSNCESIPQTINPPLNFLKNVKE